MFDGVGLGIGYVCRTFVVCMFLVDFICKEGVKLILTGFNFRAGVWGLPGFVFYI